MQAHPKGEQQKSAETCPHYLLEALGSRVAREAPAQDQQRSAKLLIPRTAEKHTKNARTEPFQQGFQDRRQAQSENARRQAQSENARRQAQSENARHQAHSENVRHQARSYIFQFFLACIVLAPHTNNRNAGIVQHSNAQSPMQANP